MSASKILPSLAEAMRSDGFVILGGRVPEGEGFIIFSKEPTLFDGLHQISVPANSWIRGTSSPITAADSWVSGPLTEAELRSKLAKAGLSTGDIDARIQFARDWATTITREPGSEPVLWWPRLDS